MDAAQALQELSDLSSQVELAVVLRDDGSVVAASADDSERADALARAALGLVKAAEELYDSGGEVTRVDVELPEGALFVVREGERSIAATTPPEPTTGLVVYDLRTCLRRINEEPKPKRRRRSIQTPKESE